MDVRMPRRSLLQLALMTLVLAFVATPGLEAQQEVTQIAQEKMAAYAKAFVAIGSTRDAIQAELAAVANKTPEAQVELREKLRQETTRIIQENGMTEEEYKRITYVVSYDDAQRKSFEDAVAKLNAGATGA